MVRAAEDGGQEMKTTISVLIIALLVTVSFKALAYDGVAITPHGTYIYTPGMVYGPGGMSVYSVPTDHDYDEPLYPPELPLDSGSRHFDSPHDFELRIYD